MGGPVAPIAGYDIYFREATINGGTALGWRLGYTGNQWGGRVPGLVEKPYEMWRMWHEDPAFPEDPTQGHWGAPYRWVVLVAMLPHMTLANGKIPGDAGTRDPDDMRDEVKLFRGVVQFELTDPVGDLWTVRITGWQEWMVEQVDIQHPKGGWVARLELAGS